MSGWDGRFAEHAAHVISMDGEHEDDAALIEAMADGVAVYLGDHTGFGTVESDGRVAAYYGGHWIYLDPSQIALAALAAQRAHMRERVEL